VLIKRAFIFFVFALSSQMVLAQQGGPYRKISNTNRAPIRSFLNMFSLSISSGYGTTFFSHEISGVGLIQKGPDSLFIFDNTYVITGPISTGYNNWFNNPQAYQQIPVNSNDFILGTDSVPVTYRARGRSIPINASVHFAFDRYRFGIGGSFEVQTVGEFRPNEFKGDLLPFKPDFTVTTISRYYLLIGGEVIRTLRHMLVVDAQVGRYNLSKNNFNPDVIKKGLYFNIGVAFERSLSEYFKVYLRPSYEFKNYTVTIPENGYSVDHSMPAFNINLGVVLKFPDLRKCPVDKCRTQIDHVHGGRQYRSKVHPMWKWQDPDYGQNYPKLIKYKGKNKRKLNPY
jgi:hypothetical protein